MDVRLGLVAGPGVAVKPYGNPYERGAPKAGRPKARKRKARANGRRAADESEAGHLHPAEVRLIEHDARERRR